jgi:predicted RNase H-like nuclease (RuvC/YqgF family)
MLDNVRAEYKSLQNVKEKLNIKVASLEWEIKWLNYTIDKLKEENQTLELWLDNKEKLNEEYRKQIDKLRTDNIYEEWLYD